MICKYLVFKYLYMYHPGFVCGLWSNTPGWYILELSIYTDSQSLLALRLRFGISCDGAFCRNTGTFPSESMSEIFQAHEKYRGHIQGQQLRKQQSADKRNAQRPSGFAAAAESNRQRNTGHNRRRRSHHNRPEAHQASLDNRLFGGFAVLAL